jgi:hypothetical protein
MPSFLACSTGGFYKSPTPSQSLPYSTPIDITWDTSCLTTSYVDIYLYAPGASTPRIHIWHNVYFPAGSYQTTFQPKWWNATNSVNLQLSIVPPNTPPFQAPFPPGPIFTVTYQTPSSGGVPASADTSKPDGAVSVVNNGPFTNAHTSGGKVAAAVVIPLLLIICIVIGAIVKLRRQSGKDERRRWSEAVDRRMSTISTDWKPISVAGAQAAIRNSIAGDPRASSFSFGNIRPASSIVVEGGQAGIGARARTVLPDVSNGTAQLRSSLATSQIMAERVSRVSFAPDVRPSSESRRTVYSRAFHTAIIPPVPDRKWEDSDHDSLSPTQANGPETLSIEDIQAHLAGKETKPLPSVDAVMPALRCAYFLFFSPFLCRFDPLVLVMRTGDSSPMAGEEEEEPELLFSAQSTTFPAIPSPTHSPLSPESASAMSSFMPMQAIPANMMSPDDMLRAYAERRATGGAGIAKGPAIPSPTYAGVGAQGGMRTLYQPPLTQTEGGLDANKKRITLESQYSGMADEDAYGGTH